MAGVFGDCIAGGGYMPIISDRVYMTEQAYMVIAGAALIKGAKSQKITSSTSAAPRCTCTSRAAPTCACPTTRRCSRCAEVARSARSARTSTAATRAPSSRSTARHRAARARAADHREAYDAHAGAGAPHDQSLFWEVMPESGEEMICGVGRVGGLYAGFVINRQGLVDDPEHPGERRPAGILYRAASPRSAPSRAPATSDGIPLVWLQDISGFDIGAEAERQGCSGYGSSLIYTNSTNDVPMFTVLLRKASGAGYYAMAGLPYDPVVQLSTTISRLS
jgi:3-methylcrotonyl-CoA carboxylase beta subunit